MNVKLKLSDGNASVQADSYFTGHFGLVRVKGKPGGNRTTIEGFSNGDTDTMTIIGKVVVDGVERDAYEFFVGLLEPAKTSPLAESDAPDDE